MTSVVYYLPNIPDNSSTARYNHAKAISQFANSTVLITYLSKPPTEIAVRYDDVHVLKSDSPLVRAVQAKRITETSLNEADPGTGIYLTSFHYAPALSGWLSDHCWVLDVYDDPHQMIYRNPGTYHEISVRALVRILSRAARAVHTVHPATPHTFGKEKLYARNGATVDQINPRNLATDEGPLQGVYAGAKAGVKILIEGIAASSTDTTVDVYGAVDADNRRLATRLDVADQLNFHGQRAHEEVVDSIEQADVGFCLMTEKTDWYYAHPIKIGEYLAGGTIPIASAFPGVRQLTRDAGILIKPDPNEVTEALDTIATDDEIRHTLGERARERARTIDWRDERDWFAKQALLGTDCWRTGW